MYQCTGYTDVMYTTLLYNKVGTGDFKLNKSLIMRVVAQMIEIQMAARTYGRKKVVERTKSRKTNDRMDIKGRRISDWKDIMTKDKWLKNLKKQTLG